jgi:hypothetical protein
MNINNIEDALSQLHYFPITDDFPQEDESEEDRIARVKYLRKTLKEMLPELMEGNTDPHFLRNISRIVAELQMELFGQVSKDIEGRIR